MKIFLEDLTIYEKTLVKKNVGQPFLFVITLNPIPSKLNVISLLPASVPVPSNTFSGFSMTVCLLFEWGG